MRDALSQACSLQYEYFQAGNGISENAGQNKALDGHNAVAILFKKPQHVVYLFHSV